MAVLEFKVSVKAHLLLSFAPRLQLVGLFGEPGVHEGSNPVEYSLSPHSPVLQ